MISSARPARPSADVHVRKHPMPNFKLHAPPYVISITGYEPKGGIIRSGRHLKRHDGPTMELTLRRGRHLLLCQAASACTSGSRKA